MGVKDWFIKRKTTGVPPPASTAPAPSVTTVSPGTVQPTGSTSAPPIAPTNIPPIPNKPLPPIPESGAPPVTGRTIPPIPNKPLPPTPAADPLSAKPDKMKKLEILQNSKLHLLVGHAHAVAAAPKKDVEHEKGDAVEGGNFALDTLSDAGGVVGGGLGTHESFLKKADPNASLSDRMGDTVKGMAGIDIIRHSVNAIKGIFTTIMKIVEAVKNKDKKGGGPGKLEIVDSLIDTIKSSCQAVMSGLGLVEKLSKAMPIVGAVFGAVSAIMEFITHVSKMHSANKGRRKMGKLKEASTKGLHGKHEEAVKVADDAGLVAPDKPEYLEKKKKKGGEEKHINRFQARIRVKKLQEKEEQNPDAMTPEEKAELQDLQEYLLTHEIHSADKKRMVQGGLDITADVINFAASLATLDPTIGSAVGIGLSGAVSLGQAGHKVGRWIRQKVRDRKGKKTSSAPGTEAYEKIMEKTTKGKDERRGSLGKYMVEKVKKLQDHNLAAMDGKTSEAKFDQAAGEYNTVQDQIYGMGVYYGVLLSTKNQESLEDAFGGSLSREGKSDGGMLSSFKHASGH